MSTRPKVTRLVMYKHGVAYLERLGPADGEFELTFRKSDMNDVLKSLAVAVTSGEATVGAVAYEAPAKPDEELASRSLLLEPGAALPGLLNAVRGRTVEVTAGGLSHRGEVIGIDEVEGGMAAPHRVLVMRVRGGTVAAVDLAQLETLELVEGPSRDDLDYLIDRSRAATAGDNRTVRVHVNGRADELRVSYIVPAPIWRVSYRLVCEGDTVTLVAMGIVHNPVDEDLDDVELTLTTGQPVSFDIDLYHGKRVQRAVVEEADRAAAAPISYESGGYGASADDTGYFPAPAAAYGGGVYPAPAAMPAPRALRSKASLASSFEADLSERAERGEHFEYRVANPISLKRGIASMVPLVVARLDGARKERIWREGSSSAPDIVLAFDNTTGAVLEEGPAVVYDDGSYAGEAMVPYATRGKDLRLAFAKDLSITCNRTSTVTTVSTRLLYENYAMVEELRRDETHVLRADNDGDEPVEVIFELPKIHDTTLREGAEFTEPFERTASFHRFRVEAPARGFTEAKVGESRVLSRATNYVDLSSDLLHRWLQDRLLDDAGFTELARVLEHWEQARRFDEHATRLEADRADAFEGQTRISQQLNVLREGGAEGAVRQRNVQQLVALQDQAAALDVEIRRSRENAEAARQAASVELQRLVERRGERVEDEP